MQQNPVNLAIAITEVTGAVGFDSVHDLLKQCLEPGRWGRHGRVTTRRPLVLREWGAGMG